jgi:P-type Mg2+ transporter
MKINWCKESEKKILETLNSSPKGLTREEAEKRLKTYGDNKLSNQKPRSFLVILSSQFKNWLIVMLLGAAFLSFFLGESLDGIVIIVMVMLSVVFGFLQEYKAERVVDDLKKYVTNKARVMRNGEWTQIDASLLVPGDIVELRIGDKVPADIRLTSSDNLMTDESVITGESMPVTKTCEEINFEGSNPSKMLNMAFMGTLISEGRAQGVVTATGMSTFFGISAKSLETPEPETDFQKQIKNFSLFLFRVVLIMTLFIFGINAFLKKDILDSFLFALALAVGVTPEMLPAIITVTLSQGAMKMAKKKVVVKKLIAVEDLGNIDTLCTDKTGTITEGIFSLETFINFDEEIDKNVLSEAVLCTSGFYEKTYKLFTPPIDKAILNSGPTKNLKESLLKIKLIDENVFDYERKRMSVLVQKKEGANVLIAKGAYESIFSVCKYIISNGKRVKINKNIQNRFNDLINKYEDKSYRIIAVSQKNLKKKSSAKYDESDMTLSGFLLFKDPVKLSSKAAIKKFTDLGVDLKIISGDSLKVSMNVALEAGFSFDKSEVVDGESLENMDQNELLSVCRKAKIFARVTPEQKYKIITTLNFEGHIVGYIGDGVNDVPALRAADVGISVDTGVDIAKDASDIILLEKNLEILAEGMQSGRKTFGNIMKYILNTISANYGNMSTVAISSLFIKFIPLLPSQILLNNFISDIPLFAVATDNVDANFVKKPKKWNLPYIKSFMIYYGVVSTFFDMMLILPMLYILKVNVDIFRTAWFVESSISEILVTFAIRTKLPFYKSRPSKWLLYLSLGSILVVTAMPFLGFNAFRFVILPLPVWGLITFDLAAYFTVTEIVKKRFFQKFEGQNQTN